ncbi:ABC transporter ATP-binding protein [Gluconobacter wancherniae]|uniref:ABC transporter ATP-binding protein n=1 Tax=Gluconobacter wancherniae TaxID=1307955 RepID=UPI001B8B6C23|nr:ATP-binding cassette domain-containing protein [Gluconobacter wancherniae]MBS1089364.1 ABC transporter ATP-binding protein [Gluconobacter wancherniae]
MSSFFESQGLNYSVRSQSRSFFQPRPTRPILQNINLHLAERETLGIIGSSGSGKSTLARILSGLLQPDNGHVSLRGEDFTNATSDVRQKLRPEIQMIFQDPQGALDPRQTVREIVGEPLLPLSLTQEEREQRIVNVLRDVALPSNSLNRYPRAFSGGQRQRIAIARALITKPSVIIADEAVSALDVSTQAIILNLLLDLQERYGLSYIFVSHDLAVIRHIAHRTAVLDAGHIVETGPTADIFSNPQHDTTRSLLAANF